MSLSLTKLDKTQRPCLSGYHVTIFYAKQFFQDKGDSPLWKDQEKSFMPQSKELSLHFAFRSGKNIQISYAWTEPEREGGRSYSGSQDNGVGALPWAQRTLQKSLSLTIHATSATSRLFSLLPFSPPRVSEIMCVWEVLSFA